MTTPEAEARKYIETICRDTIVRNLALGEVQQTAALQRIKDDGVEIHYWPDEMLLVFKQAWQEVIEESSANDPDFKRVYDSYKAFRDQYAEWAKISRLPLGLGER